VKGKLKCEKFGLCVGLEMNRKIALIIAATCIATAAGAVSIVTYSNNVVGPNGYLLDNLSGFVTDTVNPGNGKIFAR